MLKKQSHLVLLALLAVYIIWGSTYLGIRIAIETLPPLLMSSGRLFLAGIILFLFLRVRGHALPNRRQWRNALIIGGLMLGGGVGGTAFAEQWIASGLAAVIVATVPLWSTLFASFWEGQPTRMEWTGLLIGFGGVIILNSEDNLQGNPLGAIIMIIAPLSWSLGGVLSRHMEGAKGSMAYASQMLAGSVVLLILGILNGEHIPSDPSAASIAAWLFLAIFGSLIAFSAYMYLLENTRITLATSYAYVNPIIAVILGVTLANEAITWVGILAMFVILTAVVILSYAQRQPTAATISAKE